MLEQEELLLSGYSEVVRKFALVIGLICTLQGACGYDWWDDSSLTKYTPTINPEQFDPFARQGFLDLSNVYIGSFTPETLRWGEQRNVAEDFSAGVFSNRPAIGLGERRRTSANFAPRLMPFGGPLSYAQGRDFSFTLDEPVINLISDANFIEYFQFVIPIYQNSGEAELSYGQYGSLRSSLLLSLPSEGLKLQVSLSHQEFGNYKDGNGVLLTNSLDLYNPKERFLEEAEKQPIYRITELATNGSYTFSPTQHLEFDGRYSETEGVLFPELRMDGDYDRGSNVSATYQVRNPSASVQHLSIRAFSSIAQQELNDQLRVTRLRDLQPDEPIPTFSTRANSRSSTLGLDFKALKDFSDSKISFGMRRYWQRWDAYSITRGVGNPMLPLIYQSSLDAYMEGQHYFGHSILSAAIRINQNDTEVEGDLGFLSQYRPQVSRRIQNSALSASLRVSRDVTDNLLAYAEIAHAVRAPDPNEMYVQYQHERAPGNQLVWIGNPGLDSVKNTSFNSGVTLRVRSLRLSVKGFCSVVEDMIYLEDFSSTLDDEIGDSFIGTAMSYNNVNALLYGGEAALNLLVGKNLQFSASLDFLQGRKTRLDGLSADPDLAEMPPLRARVAVEWDNQTWFARSQMRRADALMQVDESISETPLDGYTVIDLLLGYYLQENLLLTVGLENLSDQTYATRNVNIRNPFSNYSVSLDPGRFFYLSMKWGF